VTKQFENDALVEAAREFGGVDVFVANVGITLRSDGANVPEEDYAQLRQLVKFEMGMGMALP
jgi:NADP-dependent 3-hydroxy acid dehydrogenase YdfG